MNSKNTIEQKAANLFLNEDFSTGIELLLDTETPLQASLTTFLTLLNNDSDFLIPVLAEKFPDDHPISAMTDFGLAAKAVKANELYECDEHLQNWAKNLLLWSDQGFKYEDFPQMLHTALQHAYYFNPNIDLTKDRKHPLQISSLDLDQDEFDGPINVVSCNGIYFDEFGTQYLESCEQHSELGLSYFHVVNPTETTKRKLENFKKSINWPIKAYFEEKDSGLSYITCSRFNLALKLMEKTKNDIIVSDIDLKFLDPIGLKPGEILPEGTNGGLFERKSYMPHGICHCPISYWHNDESTVSFLQMLSNYHADRLRLTDRFWMLDQLGIYVLSRKTMPDTPRELESLEVFEWQNLSDVMNLKDIKKDFEIDPAKRYNLRRQHQEDFCSVENLEVEINPEGRVVPG